MKATDKKFLCSENKFGKCLMQKTWILKFSEFAWVNTKQQLKIELEYESD